MYLTGFADEAGAAPETQIRATRELGWKWIEARTFGSANLHDIPDQEFSRACGLLTEAGVGINCFGSAIANWATAIDGDVAPTLAQVQRALPRMRRLGAKLIRIMSFAVRRRADGSLEPDQRSAERFRRLRDIVAMFRAEGVQPVHENCMNYGGMGARYTLEMLAEVPGLELVFDTGNPTHSEDVDAPSDAQGRRPRQSAWAFYHAVRERIAYVHIKDGRWDAATGTHVHTWPGEGEGDVQRIVADLLARGYDGGFSMEPHLAVVHHDPTLTAPEAIRYANYVEYGQRFMALLRAVQPAAANG